MKGDPGVQRTPRPCLLRRSPSPLPPFPERSEEGAESFGRREAVSFGCGGSSVCVSLTEGETERRESECSFSATQN